MMLDKAIKLNLMCFQSLVLSINDFKIEKIIMSLGKFDEALDKKNWEVAIKLLLDGENISEYLKPGNTRLYLAVIDGYYDYIAEISKCNAMLMFENYGDIYFEEDFASAPIVKFIENLILRGLRLDNLVNNHETFIELLNKISSKIGPHINHFVQQRQFDSAMLSLFSIRSNDSQFKNLNVSDEVKVKIDELVNSVLCSLKI